MFYICLPPCPAAAFGAVTVVRYLMKQSLLVGLRSCSGGKIIPLLCNICSQHDRKILKKVLFPVMFFFSVRVCPYGLC